VGSFRLRHHIDARDLGPVDVAAGPVVQHAGESGNRLVHQRRTGRVDLVDRTGERRSADRGEINQESPGVRADGLFPGRALLE